MLLLPNLSRDLHWVGRRSWNFFATSHGKGAVDGIGERLKCDVQTAALTKGVVVKNIDDFIDVAKQCSQSINVLKCTKKHLHLSITLTSFPTSSLCYWNKEYFYSSNAPVNHVFKSVTNDLSEIPETTTNTAPTVEPNPHKKLETIETVTPGQWSLGEYEEEFSLGVVLAVSSTASNVYFRCHKIWKRRATAYVLSKLYVAPVKPHGSACNVSFFRNVILLLFHVIHKIDIQQCFSWFVNLHLRHLCEINS